MANEYCKIMTKEAFIEALSNTEGVSYKIKLDCLNYFIDNYPVEIRVGINPFTGEEVKEWTKLNWTITGGDSDWISKGFESLQGRKQELIDFK